MLDPFTQTQMENRFSNLMVSRRLRFSYVNGDTGGFKWKKNYLKLLLNTLAGCLNIPVLFYMSFYLLATYPGLNLKPLDMLSVVFFSAAISIFLDFFVGYIYDRSIKPGEHSTNFLRHSLSVIGTIGMVITLAFFNRSDIDQGDAARQFRVTFLFILFFFTLANTTSIKNTAYYTPSQEDRRTLIHHEYFLKGFVLFLYVAVPLWTKFWTADCECGTACSNNPADATCTGCLTKCDSFQGDYLKYFHTTSVVFVCIFGVANLILQFTLKPRKDEDREEVPTSFNRRLVEIWTNKLILKTFITSILEFAIFFGFGIWAYYYAMNEVTYGQSCLETWGSSAYLCTKSFWLQMTAFLIFLMPKYTFILAAKVSFILGVSFPITVLTFVSGILICVIGTDDTTMFAFILVFMGLYYASLPATFMIHANALYYDEYKSGVPQPYLPAALFLLSMKLGFLIGLALHLSFLNPEGPGANIALNYNQKGFGAFVIVASFVILVIKLWVNKYNLRHFDKLQIAIERNVNLQKNDITFIDPIRQEPIKAPLTSFHPLEKKFIRLMYNLNPKAILKIINGKQARVQSRAALKLFIHLVLAIAMTVLIIVFGSYFNTPWAWLMALGLIYIPIGILAMIYYYNVWATAVNFDSSKYKGVDRNILFRFSQLFEKPSKL